MAQPISIIDSAGEERFLGNLMPPQGVRMKWSVYGTVPDAQVIDESEWKRLIDEAGNNLDMPYLTVVHDQNGFGMCNASATASAIETCRIRQGLSPVKLSGGDLYRRICGGADNGSMLEDGLAESMRNGVASVTACPYLEWRRAPSNSDAIQYKVLEAFLCPQFPHCISAVLSGFDLISGVMWKNGYEVGDDGWLVLGGGGGGGHAVHGYKAMYRGSEYGIAHKNSWSTKWGRNGLCVFPSKMYGGAVGGWWAVRQATTESDDTPAPKF